MPGRGRRTDRRADDADEQSREEALPALTPAQLRFLGYLLSGSSITKAAALAGISKRAALYWLGDETHPVHVEYERMRYELQETLASRVKKIYEQADKAMLSLLDDSTPPFIRVAALKLLEPYLTERWAPGRARSAFDLAYEEASEYHEILKPSGRVGILLWDDRGKPRIVD